MRPSLLDRTCWSLGLFCALAGLALAQAAPRPAAAIELANGSSEEHEIAGIVRPGPLTREGKTYVLLDPNRNRFFQLQPPPGASIEAYLGQKVVVQGTLEEVPGQKISQRVVIRQIRSDAVNPTMKPLGPQASGVAAQSAVWPATGFEEVAPASTRVAHASRLEHAKPEQHPATAPSAPQETKGNPALRERLASRAAAMPIPEPENHEGAVDGYWDDNAGFIERECQPTCAVGCYEFFASVDYLLMTPRRRSMDYAISDPNLNDAPEGTIESLDWGAESGVRVAAGFQNRQGWEFVARYTTLSASDTQSLTAPAGGQLWTTLTLPSDVDTAEFAEAYASLHYDVLDFELGRCVVSAPDFGMRVFGGLRFAWIDQQINAYYDGGTADDTRVTTPQTFNGQGIRAGAEGTWRLPCGWSVFGRAAGSLLVGSFDSRLTETDNDGAVVNADVQEGFTKVVPVAELAVGVRKSFGHWYISAGYEIVNWGGLVDTPDFVDDTHTGKPVYRTSDLSLDGLFAQLGCRW